MHCIIWNWIEKCYNTLNLWNPPAKIHWALYESSITPYNPANANDTYVRRKSDGNWPGKSSTRKSIVTGPVYTSRTPKKKSKFITSFRPPQALCGIERGSLFPADSRARGALFIPAVKTRLRYCWIPFFRVFDIQVWKLSQPASDFPSRFRRRGGVSLSLPFFVTLWTPARDISLAEKA